MRHDLQAVPVTCEGRQFITFIDPMRLTREGFALDARVAPLLAMLDGRHDLRDIQEVFMHLSGGAIVPMEDIEALIRQFDQAFLLDSEAFRLMKKTVIEDFAGKTVREPMLAGISYEQDPERLTEHIASVEAELPPLSVSGRDIVGILAPHIEIVSAEKAYVDAYRRVRGKAYDLVIILGVNHHGGPEPFCLTGKDFVTPLGTLVTDREFVSELKTALPHGSLTPCDYDHLAEHSIEFQAVFLANYLGTSARIVPVLCAGIHEHLANGTDYLGDERVRAFIDAVLRIIEKTERTVLFVSGVDFSHVGRKFGHHLSAETLIGRAVANDRVIIDHLMNARASDIFLNARETGDQYNVCGLSSMMIFSALTGRCAAELLHHGTYDEPATASAVTFASMVFTRE